MKFEEAFIVVGCPLPNSFRADARTIGMLEAWRRKNVVTYYPASNSPEFGYDKIVRFAQSIKPKPTHILFVDYDVLPRATTLRKLFNHNKDIICGTYPAIQKSKLYWCLSKDKDFNLMDIEDLPSNPFKVHTGSNGMMLVKMEVFDKLKWPYWRTEFFEDGSKRGADVKFFNDVAEAGIDVWVDPKLTCGHFKMVELLGITKNYIKE